MKSISLSLILLASATPVFAQALPPPDDPPPPMPAVQSTTPSPFPPGMRLIVGTSGVLARNTPSMTGTCGNPPHECTTTDAIVANSYGVVQNDAPVLDPGGWYWIRVTYDSGVTGWSTASGPDRLASLSPPQMIQGSSFQIVADYSGPALTAGRCVKDGVNSMATLQLQPSSVGQTGTMRCPWTSPPLGNHIQVIQAINANGTASSAEFQFAITAAPVPPVPTAPQNLRISPVNAPTAIQTVQEFNKDTAKPDKGK